MAHFHIFLMGFLFQWQTQIQSGRYDIIFLYIWQHTSHFDKNKHLHFHQSGFWVLHLVMTYLFKSTNDWYGNIDNSEVNAVIFIDINKAFSTVYHEIQ